MTQTVSGVSIGRETSGRRDWPLVTFFVLAYAIAWGIWLILGWVARQSGVENTATLLRLAEALQFEGVALAVPGWAVYLLVYLMPEC